MQFNDTDHQVFADLAKSCLIEFSSYADLASKLETHIESLDDGMRQAEKDAESAQEDAQDAHDRAADFVEFTRDLYRTFGPHACSKPTDGDLAALVASARELLARNGVNP